MALSMVKLGGFPLLWSTAWSKSLAKLPLSILLKFLAAFSDKIPAGIGLRSQPN